MYFDRVNAKSEAKQTLRTAQPSPLLVTLVYLLLTTGISTLIGLFLANPFAKAVTLIAQGYDPIDVYRYVFGGGGAMMAIFVTILLSLYFSIMAVGYQGYTLRLSRGEPGTYGALLEGFNMAVKVVVLDILMSLFVFLWSMLFLIPGIVASYRYSQAVYCLLDDPEISALEAIRRSKAMMAGQKLNLFVLELSFFGWVLLSAVISSGLMYLMGGPTTSVGSLVRTLAIGVFNLWLNPYMNIVFADFYNHLIGWNGATAGDSGYQGPELEF